MATERGEEVSIFSLDDKDIDMFKLDDDTKSLTSAVIPESEFVKIIGLVEDIFVGEDFQIRHSEYFTKYCTKFSKGTDPPLGSAELENLTKERFNIFRTYSVETAAFLESELKRSLGDKFEIDLFIQEVERRTQLAEAALAREKASSSGGESSDLNSPRRLYGTNATTEGFPQHQDNNNNSTTLPSDLSEIMGGEIFEMLLTLKDYARFQELMVDYLEMVQGTTPDFQGLVSLRHLSEDEDEEGVES